MIKWLQIQVYFGPRRLSCIDYFMKFNAVLSGGPYARPTRAPPKLTCPVMKDCFILLLYPLSPCKSEYKEGLNEVHIEIHQEPHVFSWFSSMVTFYRSLLHFIRSAWIDYLNMFKMTIVLSLVMYCINLRFTQSTKLICFLGTFVISIPRTVISFIFLKVC